MAIKKVTVRFEGEFEFEYDPETPVFKEMMTSFEKNIYEGGERGVVENIAHNILLNGSGWDNMFEGIGYIDRKDRINPNHRPGTGSGITINTDRPDIEYDTTEH
jgi:hypothetical protein